MKLHRNTLVPKKSTFGFILWFRRSDRRAERHLLTITTFSNGIMIISFLDFIHSPKQGHHILHQSINTNSSSCIGDSQSLLLERFWRSHREHSYYDGALAMRHVPCKVLSSLPVGPTSSCVYLPSQRRPSSSDKQFFLGSLSAAAAAAEVQ